MLNCRRHSLLALAFALVATTAAAEVVGITITTRAVVANGQAFGATGAYEKLAGTLEFALKPGDTHNAPIVDLGRAAAEPDGRVHFTSDFYVLRPVDAAHGNKVLLFDISNRGGKGLLTRFNAAPQSSDPTTPADFGNGFLMREGYTLVWVGWEFDVPPTLLKVVAPAVTSAPAVPLRVQFVPGERQAEARLTDAPYYPPSDLAEPGATLSVRDRFWAAPQPIARNRWRFVAGGGAPRLAIEGGFEPGRLYEVTYHASGRVVAGVGLAAIRDAAAAFRFDEKAPVRGDFAYVWGASQSGRFLRDFLHDGFNVDERNRRVFDAVWPHIAGAAGGSFNEPFATPTSLTTFVATKFPFTDAPEAGADGQRDGLLARYSQNQQPKVVYTNTSVEYWGAGRAAALTHVNAAGTADLSLPDNVRIYLLAGTQHSQAPIPPPTGAGEHAGNPIPQGEVMRALLKQLDEWVRRGIAPPPSAYPRLADGTLTPVQKVRFPALAGLTDPRTISGPGRFVEGTPAPLPFLVPQVDADGNELAGIRVPEVTVPLATTTGWNFRAPGSGNPGEVVPLLGSYLPFARTLSAREQAGDPRPSIDERYGSRDVYLQKIKAAAEDLIARRYLLRDDLDSVLARARAHWDYATGSR